jgi:O-methyltransferase
MKARDHYPDIDSIPGRKRETFPEIRNEKFWDLYDRAKDYSLVHITGFYNAFQSMEYIFRNGLKGDIVECGCYFGGMAAFIGLMRKTLEMENEIILYDTFKGQPVGTEDMFMGNIPITTPVAAPSFREITPQNIKSVVGSLDGYTFVEGMVEETLVGRNHKEIALLRLDTDFYESTKCEFEILYPRLVRGGVLIVDDYGCFDGSRRATDEYLSALPNPPLLNRIDIGVWAGVKP